jgi:Secretory lipase
MRRYSWAIMIALITAVAIVVTASGSAAAAALPPSQDPFYAYSGATPLGEIQAGTVLKTRTVPYHVLGVPTPVSVVQLLYRTVNAQGQPAVNVTSVIKPPVSASSPKVVAYGSFYDSLNPSDEPSYQIAGGVTLGGLIPDAETLFIAPFLLGGDTVVIDDTEGEHADFAAGIEYGTNTLDAIRATFNSPTTGVPSNAEVALLGYSGGAIATEWASELAPSYAPDVNRRLVGAAMGGVFVDPLHNLPYVSGSTVWAGVMPAALVGLARAYGLNLSPYLSADGQQIAAKVQDASIVNVLGQYPGLTFAQLVKPQYANPESIPPLLQIGNDLIMGSHGTPTTPLLIAQGADGLLEGTLPGGAGIGPGDGVMVAGDVRSLAREYCQRGVSVQYDQYDLLSHTTTAAVWAPQAVTWVDGRFAGTTAPQNCSQIPVGNSLTPETAP